MAAKGSRGRLAVAAGSESRQHGVRAIAVAILIAGPV
jgi:hypothetical protein